jgi:hypothetical protein
VTEDDVAWFVRSDLSKIHAVLLPDGRWHDIVEGSLVIHMDNFWFSTPTHSFISGPASSILASRQRTAFTDLPDWAQRP